MAEGGREGNMQVGDRGISNTVEVRGFSMKTSQELMEMYFENSRRSGGGDVEEVKISDEVAYITFKEAEVAQKVASRSNHQVDGHTLTVTLFHPLPPKPCYQNRVLIQGVNNAITEELLRNFLETKTKAEVTEFLYGEEDGNVVVTLSDNIDIVQLGKIFQESSIQGVFLKAARVAISNCILVQNLHPSSSHDAILYYFENKRRSGGGDVERVEMKTEERYCLIYFEDPSVIDRVLGQSHNVDGVDLEIHLHHECLGRRSSRKKSDLYLKMSSPGNKDSATLEDENADNQAKDKSSSSVSSNPEKESDFVEVQEWQANDGKNCTLPLCVKYKRAPDMKVIKYMKNIPCSWNFHLYWNFYTKTEPGKQMLHEILNKYNCSVAVFAEDEDLFIFEISEKIFEQESDVVQLIHVVLDSVHKCAQQFLYLDNILVDQRIQGDILQVVRQRKELNIARFELMGQQNFDALCVICTEKDQTLVLHSVTEIIHMVKECFENHEEIIDVDHKWQKVMKTFGYLQKLCEKYPNVTIISDKTEAAIMLRGPRDQSKPAADHFLELLGTASSEVQEDIFSPVCQFEIFTYPEMFGYIDNIVMEHSIVWIPNHQTKKIHLFCKKYEKKKGVDKFIRGCVQERLYPLAKDQTAFSAKIIRSLEELKKMHTGKMVFSSSHKGLLLTTSDDIFESIDDAVQEIICKETELQISRVHEEAEGDRTKTTIAEKGQFPKQSNENENRADTTEQHGFQAEENTHEVKITGQAVKLFSEEWIHKSLDTSCIKIEMDEDEYILLCETEFFSKYHISQIYSRPVMKLTCKREKCNEIQKAFDEHLNSLRMNGKHEIRLEKTLGISKVREYVKDLHADCIVRTGDESGIVVMMWTTYEEYLKLKHKLLNFLGILDTIKDSRKKRQYRTEEVVSVTEKETYALDKTNLQVDSQLGAAFETAEGLIVQVYKRDITRLAVDCIVNAANEHLANAAGVAKAIEDAAGEEFIQECQNSVRIYGTLKVGEARACTGGDLKCKVIINAVGPRWSTYRDKKECLAVLRDTVRNCLELSNGNNHETIALPSISAGIFGMPLDLCAEQYCQAIISFSKETSRDLMYLKEVHFVDIKQDRVDVIHSTFSKWLKSSSGTPFFQITPFSSDKETSTNSRHFLSLGNVSTEQHQRLMHQQPATLYDTVKIIQHNTKQEYFSSSLQFTAGGELKNSLHQEGGEKHQAEMTPSGSSVKLKGLPAQVSGFDLNKNLHQEGADKQYTTNQTKMTQSTPSTKQMGAVSFKTISPKFEVFIASDRKLNIYVVHADITAMSVDAMVSTEDKYLSGKGAIARSVRKIADDAFAKTLEQLRSVSSLSLCDVVITGVRGMPCKFVLHAVSPHWDKNAVIYNRKFEADVSRTIFNVLKKAEENKLESVAVPFFGTSDDEEKRPTPVDTCARAMIKGLMDYIQSNPSSSIAHVLFVSSDMVILQGIMDALHLKSREMAMSELMHGKITPCQPILEIINL